MVLDVSQVSKRFTGTLALDAVDFDVQPGEVHALLGENGAGKSTLIKVLAGVHRADGGTISVHGRVVDPTTEKLPITFIHQDLGLVDSMTVAENIALIAGYPRQAGLISWSTMRERATSALDRMGGGVDAQARVSDLPAAERSIVAIARAMAVTRDILVLDEPTAALPEADVGRLLDALTHLRAAGVGLIYVSHRLDEVFRIADRVTVLRDGRRVWTGAIRETDPKALVHHIVGRDLADVFVQPSLATAAPVLQVRDLIAGNAGPVTFDVGAGEILGLVGLRGAGHDIVGRAIFGDRKLKSGQILLNGAPLVAPDPESAVRSGIGFVSSKRGEESMAPTMSVRENLFMNPRMTGHGPLHPISPRNERQRAGKVLDRFSVRPRETERAIATLSGGNQQKIIVARWMEAGTTLMVLEEPTFGVDVGSKADIYALLQTVLERGLAVLLVSSDFEEVAGICHRALIFDHGQVVAELNRETLSVSRLTALSSGAGADAFSELDSAYEGAQ